VQRGESSARDSDNDSRSFARREFTPPHGGRLSPSPRSGPIRRNWIKSREDGDGPFATLAFTFARL